MRTQPPPNPALDTVEIDTTTTTGREWFTRLHPASGCTAQFAVLHRPTDTAAYTDPTTGAPAVRRDTGRIAAAVPRRLPATGELAELILDHPIWVRTTDATLHLAPRNPSSSPNWGYRGGGPVDLADTIDQLLTDITTDITTAAPRRAHATPAGLRTLTRLAWPPGTVLTRDVLTAARDGHRDDNTNSSSDGTPHLGAAGTPTSPTRPSRAAR